MFSKFKKQIKTVFVDVNSPDFKLNEKVNVILSPSLYWVKRVSLPVKSIREARPLLESLFEDILPEANYSYTLYKDGDEYFVFAYEDRYILEILATKGISAQNINRVYFAQSELATLENAKSIDEDTSILVKDSLVILLPNIFANADEKLDVSSVKLSKHNIILKQFGHIVNEKSFYTIIGLLAILIILVLVEYFVVLNKKDKLQNRQDKIFSSYHLKPTVMQNKALYKHYKNIYRREIKLRNIFSTVLHIKLNDSHKLILVEYKNRKLKVAYSGLKKSQESYIERAFNEKKLTYTSYYRNNIWYVEFAL